MLWHQRCSVLRRLIRRQSCKCTQAKRFGARYRHGTSQSSRTLLDIQWAYTCAVHEMLYTPAELAFVLLLSHHKRTTRVRAAEAAKPPRPSGAAKWAAWLVPHWRGWGAAKVGPLELDRGHATLSASGRVRELGGAGWQAARRALRSGRLRPPLHSAYGGTVAQRRLPPVAAAPHTKWAAAQKVLHGAQPSEGVMTRTGESSGVPFGRQIEAASKRLTAFGANGWQGLGFMAVLQAVTAANRDAPNPQVHAQLGQGEEPTVAGSSAHGKVHDIAVDLSMGRVLRQLNRSLHQLLRTCVCRLSGSTAYCCTAASQTGCSTRLPCSGIA